MNKMFYQQPSVDIVDVMFDEAVLQSSNSNWGNANDAGILGDEEDDRTYTY